MTTTMRRTAAGAAALAAIALPIALPVALAASADAAAAPSLSVSKTTGLHAGDKITVSASGFSVDSEQSPLGLCKPPAAGLSDCELSAPNAYMGAVKNKKWNYNGAASVQLTIKTTVKGVDCTSKPGACVVAVTMLGVGSDVLAANTKLVPLTIVKGSGSGSGGGTGGGGSTTSADPTTTATAAGGDLPKTGSPDGVMTFVLVASALVVSGGAGLLLIRRREA